MILNFDVLKDSCKDYWELYIHHNFVEQLRLGILPENNFKYYLCQDYLFLIEYARVFSYLFYKSKDIKEMEFAYNNLKNILDNEINLHLDYCKKWKISKQELLATKPHLSTTSYTNYILDCGINGSYIDMLTSLSPCIIGYAEIGYWINDATTKNNVYKSWIDMYSALDFYKCSENFKIFINSKYSKLTQSEKLQQCKIFKRAVELEICFWDMSLECSYG